MDPEALGTVDSQEQYCPECGHEESGYFCRNCGTLLRGGDRVLCPRCHQIVPGGEFCNQCGQTLGGIALNLQQLAKAGDTFWVTTDDVASSSQAEPDLTEPDETVALVPAELPDWLQELSPTLAPPDVAKRIYPALSPIQETKQDAVHQRRFFLATIIVLAGLMLVTLVFMTLFILLRAGG
jgi:hypothetical protein